MSGAGADEGGAVRRPPDVSERNFKAMIALVPQGWRFVRSYVDDLWRVFVYRVTRALPGIERGSLFEFVCPLEASAE